MQIKALKTCQDYTAGGFPDALFDTLWSANLSVVILTYQLCMVVLTFWPSLFSPVQPLVHQQLRPVQTERRVL